MNRPTLISLTVVLALAASPAMGQEPEEPEPVSPDIWMAEEDAGTDAPSGTSTRPGGQPASQPTASPAAPATTAPAPTPGHTADRRPACDPGFVTDAGLAALRAVVAAGPLPARRGQSALARVGRSCGRGRLTLEIVHVLSGDVVARGARTIGAAPLHRVRLRPTRAARRLAGRGQVRLRLRVRFAPAG